MKDQKNNNDSRSGYDPISDNDSDLLYNLESEEEDNLYSLSEDDEPVADKNSSISGNKEDLETEQEDEEEYDEDEDGEEEEDEDEDDSAKGKGNPSMLLLKIMSTPIEGWKELKRRKYTPDEIASGCFYPLIAIASISEFAAKMYGISITISECLMKALSTFITFFFGYFTVLLFGGYILPKTVRACLKQDFGKEFVMMNMATLALFYTAMNLCPMIDAVLVFLPIWTIYLIYKGVRFLRIPVTVESRTKVLLAFLIIGAPLLWGWLMDLFL